MRALSEKLLDNFKEKKYFPIYIDLRRIIPLIPKEIESPESNAILIFKHILQEISINCYTNVNSIFGYNPFSDKNISQQKTDKLFEQFSKIYLEFDGTTFRKSKELSISEEETNSLKTSALLSVTPSATLSADSDKKTRSEFKLGSYISILDVTNEMENLISLLELDRLFILLDEWSEIGTETQIHLAEIIKKMFAALKVTLKIAAIPNRTNLGIRTDSKFVGLEDGGDIFGYPLDMRYVFEVNKTQTRDFFNDLLLKHLNSHDNQSINKLLEENKTQNSNVINLFLANVALNEILVASAGIPRDFINLFINSYDRFIISHTSNAKRISVKNVRSANLEWYETDKKEQIDKNPIEKQLLTEIVQEVIERKKSIHFLIPEKYSTNKHIQKLIDLRALHLRKSGYSHKDHSGVSYNVYSIDYGCYNSLNIAKSQLDSSAIDNMNLKDLRDIRRISLEDSFFQRFLMNIGEAFSCPKCRKPIDTNHLAYTKQKMCNNCFEIVA
ncbi:hypothetical protein [Rheinheimera sp.]|uniref:hypothetical protein n=1 Tax=Rheinheimera sp. TaxID=1869214 RepID=UPI00307DE90F